MRRSVRTASTLKCALMCRISSLRVKTTQKPQCAVRIALYGMIWTSAQCAFHSEGGTASLHRMMGSVTEENGELTMPIDEYMKAACWIVCPMCDEPKCIGRFNCPEIKAWIEEKTED